MSRKKKLGLERAFKEARQLWWDAEGGSEEELDAEERFALNATAFADYLLDQDFLKAKGKEALK